MPVLQILRLPCRPLTENDQTFSLTLRQNPDVICFIANARTGEEARIAFDSRQPERFPGSPHQLCLLLYDKTSRAPLGVARYIQENNECVEVGFLLTPEAQGKGYGAESPHAVCECAFVSDGSRRLTTCVIAGNEVLRCLLERVGSIHEGTLRVSYWLHQIWHDDWIFGLLKQEYQPSKTQVVL